MDSFFFFFLEGLLNSLDIYEETTSKENQEPEIEPEKPCFIPSGILARYTNTVKYVIQEFEINTDII